MNLKSPFLKVWKWVTKTRLRKILSSILVVLIFLTSIRYLFLNPKEVLADTLLAFNEGYGTSINDNNGNVSAGTITGATWRTDDLCFDGKCLYFDGSGDYVSFADDADLDFTSTNTFTLTGWFRHPEISTNPDYLIAKHQSATAGGYKVYMDSDGDMAFGIDDDGTWGPEDVIGDDQSKNFDDNKWHQFSVVKNGTTGIYLYVDGNLIDEDTSLTANGSLVNAASFYIGIDADGSSNGWSGFIDEVKIVRTARTAAEIKTDYLGSTTSATGDGPVAHWKMDESSWTNNCSTDSVFDSSSNGNHGDACPNSTGPTGGATGKFGNAGSFDGTDDYVSVADNDSLSFANNTMSASFWMKRSGNPAANEYLILKGVGSWEYNVFLSTFGFIGATLYSSGGSTVAYAGASISVTDGGWHHVGVSSNGSVLAIYIDGVLGGSTTSFTSSMSNTASNLYIGDRSDQANAEFQGILDDIRLYNYARSQIQILEDMQGFPPSGLSASFGPDNSWISNGLVGYWKMDETATPSLDSSGNGNSGTWNGNTYSSGKFGNGGSFDGTNDYVATTDIDYGAGNQISVSAWFKYSTCTGGGSECLIVSKNQYSGPYKIFVNGGYVYFHVNGIDLQAVVSVADNVWHHVTGTFDGSTCRIYLDGIFKNSTACTPTSNNELVTIGGDDADGTYQPFNGKIDEVRIYNRALSPAEVAKLYNWAPGPLIDINFDNSSGSTFYDKSGNAHNAAVQDLATAATCNNWLFRTTTMDTWIKVHDSIESGTQVVQNLARSVTYTSGVDYDMDYATGSIRLITGGSMAISTYYYIDSTCTNTGPKIVPGKFGNALDFDGADDSLMITSAANLATNNNTRVTQMAWVYIDSDTNELGANASHGILSHNFYNPRIQYQTSQFTMNIQFTDTNRSFSTGTTFPFGNWYHVAGTWDGTYGKIFVNGVLAATSADWSAYTVSTKQDDWYIGRVQLGASRGIINGKLDEIKYYNYARTPGQIIEDMNAGHPAPGSPVGSAYLYYRFDEGYGDTAYNAGTAGINASLAGATSCPQSGDSACPLWTNSGKYNKALSFDIAGTTDDYALVSDATLVLPKNDFTYTVWFYHNASSQDALFMSDNGGAGNEILLWNNGGVLEAIVDGTSVTGTTTYSTGAWHFAVLTRTGSTITLYLDGKTEATGTDGDTLSFNSTNCLLIGADADAAGCTSIGNEWDGYIDELKVYNLGFTNDQVKVEYNRGANTSLGSLSTDASGNPSNSDTDSYCPPGEGVTCTAPKLEWKLDENTGTSNYDTSGNGATGVWTGTPLWVSGNQGSALNFNGTSDRLKYTPTTWDGSSTGWTVSLWVKADVTGQSQYSSAFASSDAGTLANSFQIDTGGAAGCSGMYRLYGVENTGGAAFPVCFDTYNTSWTHLLVTLTTGGTVTTYMNGVFKNESTPANGFTGSFSRYKLGASRSDGNFFDGTIDNLKIYDRVLTQSEIAWDYNKGKPVGWWKLDECTGTTINDSAGNIATGTVVPGAGGNTTADTCATGPGSTMWGDGQTGKLNGSLGFDGADDAVTFAADSKMNLDKGGSVVAWIKPNSSGEGTYGRIIDKSSDLDNTGGYSIQMNSNAITGQISGSACSSSVNSVNFSEWTHVVFTFDGTNWKIYLNGTLSNTCSRSTLPPTTSLGVTIGNRQGATDRTFDGLIDDVRIYRYPLTTQQIKTVMGEGAVRFGPNAGSP